MRRDIRCGSRMGHSTQRAAAFFMAAVLLYLLAAPATPATGGGSVAGFFKHYDVYDFRKTRWGMTPDEVVKSEGSDFRYDLTLNPDGSPNENGFIEYASDVNSYHIITTYNFHANKLVMVSIRLENNQASKKEQMENLMAVRREIIAAYGPPSLDSTTGAPGDGALMSSQWRTPKVYIFLTLFETNGEYSFTVLYAEKNNFDRQNFGAP